MSEVVNMRQINLNIYTIEELKEEFPEAYKEAYNQWYAGVQYPYDSEFERVRKFIENTFNICIVNWDIDHKSARYKYNSNLETQVLDRKGAKAYSYLMYHHFNDLFRGKYYSTSKRDGSDYISRHSKIMFTHDCVITGCYIDDEILKPIYDFLEKPDPNTSFRLLIQYVVDAWINTYRRDVDDYFTEETFEGECEANDWEFFDDGRMI